MKKTKSELIIKRFFKKIDMLNLEELYTCNARIRLEIKNRERLL